MRSLFWRLIWWGCLELPAYAHVVVYIVWFDSCACVGVVAVLDPCVHGHACFCIEDHFDSCVVVPSELAEVIKAWVVSRSSGKRCVL